MTRVLAAVFAVAIAATGAACTGGSDDSGPAGGGAERIVYRVDDRTESPPLVTTQVVETDSPYGARLVTKSGPPPGGKSLGGTIWTRDRQFVVDPAGDVQALDVVPSFAGPDAHLDVALPAAERLGLVSRAGPSAVAGVACAQWRSRAPLDTAPFRPATDEESTVSCVDEQGRLLRDRWSLDGAVVRERTAVEIESIAALSSSALVGDRTPQPQPTSVSSTSVKPEPQSRLSDALGIGELPAPPGFTFDRSVALIDVDRTAGAPQVVNEGAGFAWVDGDRLVTLVIRRGLRAPLPEPSDGVRVRLGANGAGRLAPVFTGLRIQLRTPEGLVLTATGDIPEVSLRTWVSALPL